MQKRDSPKQLVLFLADQTKNKIKCLGNNQKHENSLFSWQMVFWLLLISSWLLFVRFWLLFEFIGCFTNKIRQITKIKD